MKRLNYLGISLLISAMMFIGSTSNALALTGACTEVTNMATLSYAVGGVGQTDIESAPGGNSIPGAGSNTFFYVDSKVDLSMSAVTPIVTATGLNNLMRFAITNEGNDTQRYALHLYAGDGEAITTYTDNFDMLNIRIVADPAANGVFDSSIDPVTGVVSVAGGETVLATGVTADGTFIVYSPDVTGDLGGGGNVLDIYVIADVPSGQATDDDAHYTLQANTFQIAGVNGTDGSPGTETGTTDGVTDFTEPSGKCVGGQVVLADGDADDPADGNLTPVGAASDAPRDGAYFATGTYTVSSAVITVDKQVTTLWDPVNGVAPNARPIPGAYVQYSITISNAVGSAAATLNTITDLLHASLAHDPDFSADGGTTAGLGGVGNGFEVTHTAATRSTAPTRYYSTAAPDAVDIAGANITADFNLALPDETPGTTYTGGELRGGESVTVTFNAIIQ